MVQPTEVELPGVRFTAVTAGATHTCALADDRLVYCWGMMTPDALSVVGPTRVEGLDDVRMIETVKYHTCAVRYSRPTLYCFGSNLFVRKPADGGTVLSYKLGPEAGDAPSSAAPVEVKLPMGVDVLDIGLGFESTFALGVNGVIYSWGYNTRNMLGTGSTEDFVPTPAPVMIDDPRYTVARVLDTAVEVLRSDGSDQCAKLSGPVTTSRYVCWGRNDYGELGFGRDGGFTQPFAKETVIPEAARDLVRGEDHGCFLMEVDGVYQVWCYGRAARVGNGAGLSTEPGVATPNQPIPAPVVWNPPEVVSEPE
jgi:alpha-tubulin suppressor-like RCC1 family protein